MRISLSPSSNLLEGTGDDKISVVHGYKISCKLTRKVILVIQLLPVKIRIRVLCLLKCMSNGTLQSSTKPTPLFFGQKDFITFSDKNLKRVETNLCDTQFMCQQRSNNVSITVISNDKIRLVLQLLAKFMCNILINQAKLKFLKSNTEKNEGHE